MQKLTTRAPLTSRVNLFKHVGNLFAQSLGGYRLRQRRRTQFVYYSYTSLFDVISGISLENSRKSFPAIK